MNTMVDEATQTQAEAPAQVRGIAFAALEQDRTRLQEELQRLFDERQRIINQRVQIDTAIAQQQGAIAYIERVVGQQPA